MDLFKHIQGGKYGSNPELKREAKHELSELGGFKKAESFEKNHSDGYDEVLNRRSLELKNLMSKHDPVHRDALAHMRKYYPDEFDSKTYAVKRCGKCNRFGHSHSECSKCDPTEMKMNMAKRMR